VTLALLFPGQGSQVVGMGRELARREPLASRTFEEANEVLGIDLTRILWEGPEDVLVLTKNAQPGILAHSVAVHRVIQERLGEVAMAAGHSLGEFSAWVAAGSLSFGDALRAVRRRGELMYDAGVERPGTMAAILGLEDAAVEEACREASGDGHGVVVPANLNAPGQVVVSGDVEAVERAVHMARRAGAKRAVRLNVSGAFHSPLMSPAEEGLRERLASMKFEPPVFPVVSNVTARPVTDPDEARELLARQLTSPVRWAESVGEMVARGADRFLELGPGNVLTGLNRRNARGVATYSVGGPDDLTTVREGD
jgi:[acyl-carrier-protein] S-malonyltransferase